MTHTRLRRTLALTGALGLITTLAALPSAQATADNRPTAVVSLGDSAISGEGAGAYEPGTDGPDDFCHRSANAQIHQTAIPGIDRTINLACSGAASANVRINGETHYTEPSQADRLRAVARDNNIKMIALQLGANDDPAFTDSVLTCIKAWINPFAPGCRRSVGGVFPQRVAAMQPKVVASINDIRTVMREAGYADSDYDLVVESYASPVTEHMDRITHALDGCPLRLDDANWGRTAAVPELAAGLRQVATQTGARFLDISRATENHEACNNNGQAHWQNTITIDPSKLPQGLNLHVVQQSFHPNAAGHAQIGRCLGEFYRSDANSAQCLAATDGTLHPQPAG